MKKFVLFTLTFFLFLLKTQLLNAQTADDYFFYSDMTGNLTTDFNGNSINLSSATAGPIDDDNSSGLLTMPFPFSLFGEPVTQFSYTTNGIVGLDANVGTARTFISNGMKIICPFGGDLEAIIGGIGTTSHIVCRFCTKQMFDHALEQCKFRL
jgi:hypothetical protein